ncbi:hypothetical protein ACOBQX_07560 [Actinokineospora sp. G85]|uniref:hypothetical protein n=1 Tax=Actinokineospora sp. G85 TaxID=3406626 RepID=UPI003C719D39
MPTMIERDESSGADSHRYHYIRVVEIAGRIVRARVERCLYLGQCLAVAEVLNDTMHWTSLAAEAPTTWIHDTPDPAPHTRAVTILGPVAERLLHRAAVILASPPTTRILSPHLHGAISALLATCYGCDAETRVHADQINWAYTWGGALHIIEHPDGSVTFTKSHRDDCPFITSRGTRDCDENCDFPRPTFLDREPSQ